jgi:hypothetical protein
LRRLIIALALVVTLAACSSHPKSATATSPSETATTIAAHAPSTLITARHLTENVITAFKRAGIPITKVVFYTDETDPNHLLNRPGGYNLKVAWNDKRVDADDFNESIEVFDTPGGAAERVAYVSSFTGILGQWVFQIANSNFVLKLDLSLTKAQAEQYRAIMTRELTR